MEKNLLSFHYPELNNENNSLPLGVKNAQFFTAIKYDENGCMIEDLNDLEHVTVHSEFYNSTYIIDQSLSKPISKLFSEPQ